jgi:hypothetical protein
LSQPPTQGLVAVHFTAPESADTYYL